MKTCFSPIHDVGVLVLEIVSSVGTDGCANNPKLTQSCARKSRRLRVNFFLKSLPKNKTKRLKS